MNFYKIIIYLFGLIPALHLILIGMILIRSRGKISAKLIDIYKTLTFEIIIFLLSVYVPIADGGIFIYFLFAVAAGIPILIVQYNYYKSLSTEYQLTDMSIPNLIWGIAIVLGLIYWIIYYVKNLL